MLELAHTMLLAMATPRLSVFLADWPARAASRIVESRNVPALRWLPQIADSAPPFSRPLVQALAAAASSLAWHRSYGIDAVDGSFYDNYGWTELAGLSGPVASTRLACGVLLLGPDVTYPAHRHEAEEIYVPLAGAALWRQGDALWRERRPGEVIHHASEEVHAMQTSRSPLLALYLWRSRDLNQTARLVEPPAGDGV